MNPVTHTHTLSLPSPSQLRKELASFEPSFFEEVEDLKFNYQESIKKNIEYEQKIVSLSQQLGVSPPTFNT